MFCKNDIVDENKIMIHLLLGFLISVTPFPTPPLIFFQKFFPTLPPSPVYLELKNIMF